MRKVARQVNHSRGYMSNLKLGSNNDLIIDRGAVRTSGLDYTAQLVSNRLKTLYGEWQLNRTIGLPWFTDLLRHSYNKDLIYGWVSKVVLSTPNVTGLSNLVLGIDKPTRTLIIYFEVTTIYGNTEGKVEV